MEGREPTKAHYDKHAAVRVDLRDRARGPAAHLKKYHNGVKRSLIARYTCRGSTLLDIATGRGGDLRKWMDAGISCVTGLDISEVELQEARRRYMELVDGRRPHHRFQCEFNASSSLGLEVWKDPGGVTYDAVTCMFALHYFCGSEDSLRTLLQTVVANLRVGGTFFGVVPDGKCVNEYLISGKSAAFFTITPGWTGLPQAFGSAYSFEIIDTVTASTQDVVKEYLVYENVLCALAETIGLHPIQPFEQLRPPYDGEAGEASRLYATFAFKKIF
jgi:mRNA (guanine-N7-)-methyltransferase